MCWQFLTKWQRVSFRIFPPSSSLGCSRVCCGGDTSKAAPEVGKMGRIGERRGGGVNQKREKGQGRKELEFSTFPPPSSNAPYLFGSNFDRQTDRHVYLESCTINSISTTISKYIKITNNIEQVIN